MTIEQLGSIGELIAAIATVVTLAYLAIQLRHNTAATRASSLTAHTEAFAQISLSTIQDPDLSKLWWAGLASRSKLDADERRRFDQLLATTIMAHEQLWRFYGEGAVTEERWAEDREVLIWLTHQPGVAEYWEIWGPTHADSFGAVFERIMGEDLSPELERASQQSG